jgi:predicted nucleic acid-binding protein
VIFLDTDVLSYFLADDPQVKHGIVDLLKNNNEPLALTSITVYEILKGLRYRQNKTKEARFLSFLNMVSLFYFDDSVISKAAAIYGELRRKGITISDSDILIAATVIQNMGTLVTNNKKHFQHIDGLTLQAIN